MIEWLRAHQSWMWGAGAVSVVSLLAALLLLPLFVARLPVDYFVTRQRPPVPHRHPALAIALRIARNLFGLVLFLAGLAMLVLPGQGVLTALVGLTLLEFPGKFRLERALVRRGPVLRGLNWLRARRGKPPLWPPAPALPTAGSGL